MTEINIGNLEFYNEIEIGDLEYDVKIVNTGTLNYEELNNKPKINDVELKGNKTFDNLGINTITNIELEEILNREI